MSGGRSALTYLIAWIIYLAVALVEFRSTLAYLSFGNAPQLSYVLQMHPAFGIINPVIKERWFINPYILIYLFTYIFKPNIISINIFYYYFAASLAGLSAFTYALTMFRNANFPKNWSLAVAMASGFIYMSNPLFFVGDLFWNTEVLVFSLLPLMLLTFHKALTSNSSREYLLFMSAFSLITSYGLVEDSAHILTYGVVALLLQLAISRIIKGASAVKGLISLFAGFAWAALMTLPNFAFLYAQHLAGQVSYIYSGPVNPALHDAWLAAMQPIWLLADNLWFNRNIIFSNLGHPYSWISLEVIVSLALIAFSATGLLAKGKRRGLPLLLTSALLVVFGVYARFGNFQLISYILPERLTSFLATFQEGYIPEVVITMFFILVPGYLLLSLISHKDNEGKSCRDGSKQSNTNNGKKGGRPKKVLGASIIALMLAFGFLEAFPSYVYAVSPFSGYGYAIQFNVATAASLAKVSTFLQDNPEGNVFWFPGPPSIGSNGVLAARSYSYPFGSDGPFSTELFSFLVGNHSDSLINTGNLYPLAYISSMIGVKYFIFYGNDIKLAQTLANSIYFKPVANFTNAIIYQNELYRGLVYASPNALLVSGGLRTYSEFLEFQNYFYNDSNAPVPFMADTYPFINLSYPFAILADNLTELYYSLNVMASGYNYLIFPFQYINNTGWMGGDVADAGGYNWNGLAAGQPNYTWQSTYTVNNGMIFTFKREATESFSINERPGVYHLMIRVFGYWPNNFTLVINNSSYFVQTPAGVASFEWINLGYIRILGDKTSIKIISNGDAFINAIDLVPNNIWSKAVATTTNILRNRTLYLILSASNDVSLNQQLALYKLYTGKNPTYKVISNGDYALLIINPSPPIFAKIAVKYSTINTNFGQIVSIISIYNQGHSNYSTLYLVLAGFSSQAIVGGSYLKIGERVVQPIPAVGGAEGFILSLNNSDKNDYIKASFIINPDQNLLLYNIICYSVLIFTIIVAVLCLVFPQSPLNEKYISLTSHHKRLNSLVL